MRKCPVLSIAIGSAVVMSLFATQDLYPAGLVLKTVPSMAHLGDSIVLIVETSESLREAHLEFLGRRQPVFAVRRQGDVRTYRAFVGVGLNDPLGTHPLAVKAAIDGGRSLRASVDIQVLSRSFPEESIRVPEGKDRLLTSNDLAEEAALLGRVLQNHTRRQRWSGPFHWPTGGRITSPFGFRRIYNDGIVAWQHRGVDLSGSIGDPVRAPNGGKVVLSRTLAAHGHTVVIDHGQSVFSILNHLHERLVEEGQSVPKDHLVGRVGSTGIATGPHLHWGLSVGGVRVDPMPWVLGSMGDLLAGERAK